MWPFLGVGNGAVVLAMVTATAGEEAANSIRGPVARTAVTPSRLGGGYNLQLGFYYDSISISLQFDRATLFDALQ